MGDIHPFVSIVVGTPTARTRSSGRSGVCSYFASLPRAMFVSLAVSLLSATPAWADQITYTIGDYPTSQGGMDVVGTITTDGALGVIAPTDLLYFKLQTSPFLSFYGGANILPSYCSGNLWASSTQLVLPAGSSLWLRANSYFTPSDSVSLDYDNSTPSNAQYSADYIAHSTLAIVLWEDLPGALPPQFVPGQSWEIATAVAEPASLTLLVTALLGLGVASFVRRRHRAA